MAEQDIVLFGCGDVGPLHEPMSGYSSLIQPVMKAADIRFGNCERIYSTLGTDQNNGHSYNRLKPEMLSIFTDCGFDVVSVAANHALDVGPEAMMDSIANLHKLGIQTTGGGANLKEARTPAIVERKGVRVAFLAYCSILKEGYAAEKNRPGVAPMRAHTYYRPIDSQPGIPAIPVTIPYESDVNAMIEDIQKARQVADSVVVSMHWGVHFMHRIIADYQTTVAQAAFAAGADLILGHHAHVPKAVGVHGGKACFYSLSNFIMTSPPFGPGKAEEYCKTYGVTVDPEYPLLRYSTDAKRSLIAKAVISKSGVKKVSFLPLLIDKQLRPEALRSGDARFNDAVHFMEDVSEGFNSRFKVEGDEVVVTAAS